MSKKVISLIISTLVLLMSFSLISGVFAQNTAGGKAVTGVAISSKSIELKEGETATLKATVIPVNATDQKITWSTSNANVASVSNGRVTAKKAGTATITATTRDGNKKANCRVNVKAKQKTTSTPIKTIVVKGVTLNKKTLTLTEGQSETLKATINPSNATNQKVTWTTSNANVASVSNGKVTAKKAGTAIIIVITEDGKKTANCKVTVKENEKVEQITKIGDTYVVKYGSTIKLNGSGTVTSSNKNIAKVSGMNVSVIGSGKFTLTLNTNGTKKEASFFSWNAHLKTGQYFTYKDSGGYQSTGNVLYSQTYLALSKENRTFKINDYIFSTNGRYSGNEKNLIGTYLGDFYNSTSDSSIVSHFVYSMKKNATVYKLSIQGIGTVIPKIQLKTKSIEMKVGDKVTIEAVVEPKGSKIVWTTSNSKIATVSSSGKVTAIAKGTATITATVGNVKATCKVTVKAQTPTKQAGSINFKTKTVNKTVGDKAFTNQLTKVGDGTVTYTSSNTKVATINKTSGQVTIKGAGNATIMATVKDSTKYTYAIKIATYQIVVKAKETQTPTKQVGSINFKTKTVNKTVGDKAFTNQLTKVGDGTVTYTSSNTKVATINKTSGQVTIKGAGNATIMATVKDSAKYTYAIKMATYQIVVKAKGTETVATKKFDQRNEAVVKYFNDSKRNIVTIFNQYCANNKLVGYQPRIYETKLSGNIKLYLYNASKGSKTLIKTVSKDMLSYYMVPGNTYYLEGNGQSEYVQVTGNLRMLYLPGVNNARDLGGWSADGGTLKYGKIMRGADPYKINDESIFTHLGIKTIVNLRSKASYNSSLTHFSSISKISTPMDGNGQYLSKDIMQPRDAVNSIMTSVVANKNVYFHCAVGTDRTGTVAYIIEGILGVPKEQRLDDYELSYFYRQIERKRS